VLAAVVVVFVLDRLPVAVVAVATALSLWATGVLDLNQALAGFGDPVVIFIASLFVVSESLDATGTTAWAGQLLINRVGGSRSRLLAAMLVLVALIHLPPVLGVLGVAAMENAYGVGIAGPDLAVLMRHRALMFGLLGGFMLLAVFVPVLQPWALLLARAASSCWRHASSAQTCSAGSGGCQACGCFRRCWR